MNTSKTPKNNNDKYVPHRFFDKETQINTFKIMFRWADKFFIFALFKSMLPAYKGWCDYLFWKEIEKVIIVWAAQACHQQASDIFGPALTKLNT